MIKETKILEETIKYQKFCDVCGREVERGMACSKAKCEYCNKDLCGKCVGGEIDTMGDYREVYCAKCNEIRLQYEPKIKALDNEIERLEDEQRQIANSK